MHNTSTIESQDESPFSTSFIEDMDSDPFTPYEYDDGSIFDYSRCYKLLSAKQMANKPLPFYQCTQKERVMLSKAWNIIGKLNETRLFEEYKEILDNDDELKSILIRNGVVIQEQFDLLIDAFSTIIQSNDKDVIANTCTVLKMIGIQQANIYRIIPSDYTEFSSCLFLLFEKYLGPYFHVYPQSKVLLTRCWQFIFKSVTFGTYIFVSLHTFVYILFISV
eukprot:1100676_1